MFQIGSFNFGNWFGSRCNVDWIKMWMVIDILGESYTNPMKATSLGKCNGIIKWNVFDINIQQDSKNSSTSCIHKIKYVLDVLLFFWMKIYCVYSSWAIPSDTYSAPWMWMYLCVNERYYPVGRAYAEEGAMYFGLSLCIGLCCSFFKTQQNQPISFCGLCIAPHALIIFSIIPSSCRFCFSNTMCFHFVSSCVVCISVCVCVCVGWLMVTAAVTA